MTARKGQCLCGAVTLRADTPEDGIQACHCLQCQRWTGGGPLWSVRVRDLEISGQEAIATYHASEWGERAFCGTCGSTLYWRMTGRPVAFLAAGLFAGDSGLRVSEEIFVDHRADWLPPWPEASQSTEAQEQAALDRFLAEQKA